MKYKIAVLDNINLLPEAREQLQELSGSPLVFPNKMETSEQELISRTGDAEAVLASPWAKITASYLKACPTVKYIGLSGTSTANVDLEEVNKLGIAFMNVSHFGDKPAAEYMFMRLLMLARGEGNYKWRDMPCELEGKSIGIIGLGALGKTFAYFALAFGMQTSYYSLHRKPDWEKRGVEYKDLTTLLQSSEVVVISTPTNIKILGKEEFENMKPNSILIYASAGEALDKEAFLEWIAKDNNYAIFNYSAGDGYYQAFKDINRVVFPKLIAGYTRETRERLGQRMVENLKNYFKNKKR